MIDFEKKLRGSNILSNSPLEQRTDFLSVISKCEIEFFNGKKSLLDLKETEADSFCEVFNIFDAYLF